MGEPTRVDLLWDRTTPCSSLPEASQESKKQRKQEKHFSVLQEEYTHLGWCFLCSHWWCLGLGYLYHRCDVLVHVHMCVCVWVCAVPPSLPPEHGPLLAPLAHPSPIAI